METLGTLARNVAPSSMSAAGKLLALAPLVLGVCYVLGRLALLVQSLGLPAAQ